MPEEKRRGHEPVRIVPLALDDQAEIAIEARDLTMRFGDFVAVDHVNFRIRKGEIFGFLGSNGCGKSTTMKMLTGLLPASEAAPGCSARRSIHANIDAPPLCPRPRFPRAWTRWPRASAWTRCATRCPRTCPWACASACRWPWPWCTSPSC